MTVQVLTQSLHCVHTYKSCHTLYCCILLALLLLLYAVCPICCYSTVTPDTVQSRHSSTLQPTSVQLMNRHKRLDPPRGQLLVSTIDGQLHAVDLRTGNDMWTFDSTHPLLSSTQQQLYSIDNTSTSNDKPFVIPGVDGTLYFFGELGIQKLPITVDELVSNAPFRTKDNTRFIGNKHTTAILIDKYTGIINSNFITNNQFNELMNEQCSSDKQQHINDSNLLWVGKTDMSVRALDGRTGIERWNVSISTYSSMYDATERELTADELDQLHMPKFAVSVDGTLIALDLYTQQQLWSLTLNSAVTNIHFIPHIYNNTEDNSNIDDNDINGIINDPGDMMHVPHYYFDPHDEQESTNSDYVTAAINHYYRQLHNAAPNELLYVGQTNNGFYYALPTNTHTQHNLITTANNNPNNIITQSNWQQRNRNDIIVTDQQLIAPSASECTSMSDDYPACLTGFHLIDFQPHTNLFKPSLALSNDNTVYNSFLPAILPPNYTVESQALISDSKSQSFQYLLPSPPSFWSTYMPVALTSAIVSLSVTLPILTIMYCYKIKQKNKRKKKKKLRIKSVRNDYDTIDNDRTPLTSPLSGHVSDTNNQSQNNSSIAEDMNDMLIDNINVDKQDNTNYTNGFGTSTKQSLTISTGLSGDSVSSGNQNQLSGNNTTPIALPIRQPSGIAGQFILNKMIIDTNTVLGTGSMGTVVYAGQFEGRICAIKRLIKPFYGDSYADKEISLLIATDQHPNMLRYYAKEEDNDFVYIALERCNGTLLDLVNNIDHCAQSNKQQILHDIMNGLAHLHAMNIVHRDLKPANILLNSLNRAKISDMGLGKKLDLQRSSFDSLVSGSVGWQPPEVLRADKGITRLTKAVDIFSAGCVIYYILTNGRHPFGDTCEREYHILQGKLHMLDIGDNCEAIDLIQQMCHIIPNKRITADDTLTHPLFWNNEQRLQFINDVSDRIEIETHTYSLIRMTIEHGAFNIIGNDWSSVLHTGLIENLGKFRKYDYSTIRDLLRVIRNKKNHYNELPVELQHELGSVPNGYYTYFNTRFSKLLLYIYIVK